MPDFSFVDTATLVETLKQIDRETTGTANNVVTVVPDDANDLVDGPCRSFYCNTAGDVTFLDGAGNQATLTSAPLQYHPIVVTRFLATGTTVDAGGILALY